MTTLSRETTSGTTSCRALTPCASPLPNCLPIVPGPGSERRQLPASPWWREKNCEGASLLFGHGTLLQDPQRVLQGRLSRLEVGNGPAVALTRDRAGEQHSGSLKDLSLMGSPFSVAQRIANQQEPHYVIAGDQWLDY